MKKLLGMTLLLILLVVAICVFQWLTQPDHTITFLSGVNLSNLAQRIGLLGIYALGAGIVILSGGIDLSIGSVMAFVGMSVAMLAAAGWNPFVASLLIVPCCALLGFWHGFLVGKIKLQPFIATLASLLLLRGLARGIPNGMAQGITDEKFAFLGNGSYLGIPITFWILIAVALILGFLMNFTVYGRYLYAIGRNAEAVRYSGIKVNRIRTLAFVICAVLAGIAGVLELSLNREIQPAQSALMYEMWAIAAAVLGGCSLRGGEGSVLGVIVGAILIRVMDNGMNLVGVGSEWQWAVIGVIVLGGVIADASYKLRAESRTKA